MLNFYDVSHSHLYHHKRWQSECSFAFHLLQRTYSRTESLLQCIARMSLVVSLSLTSYTYMNKKENVFIIKFTRTIRLRLRTTVLFWIHNHANYYREQYMTWSSMWHEGWSRIHTTPVLNQFPPVRWLYKQTYILVVHVQQGSMWLTSFAQHNIYLEKLVVPVLLFIHRFIYWIKKQICSKKLEF